jgi:hypothetical protein
MKTTETIKNLNTKTNKILNSNLNIYWWNFGKKTLDFNGDIKQYFLKENIKFSKKLINKEYDNYNHAYVFTLKFNIGSISFTQQSENLESLIKVCVFSRLVYLGDKSQVSFLGITKKFNF